MNNGNEGFRLRELWEDHYFVLVKLGYVLLMTAYMILHGDSVYRSSAFTLALASVCVCVMTVYEITDRPSTRYLLLAGEFACVALGWKLSGSWFLVLLPPAVSDAVYLFHMPYYIQLFSVIALPAFAEKYTYLMLCILTAVIYWQHSGMILKYRKSAENYEEQERCLKSSIESNAAGFRSEIKRARLQYENIMLQDKAQLSQELHDKLGHRINGSVYQLEACRAIAGSNPEKADEILGRVTDSLREGMDEIRAVLRRERPDSRRMALLGLNLLCEECKSQYGIDAQITVDGDVERVNDKIWNVIYDNCGEAVTNALKYARCSRMRIEIKVLNKLIRCCVSDNGVGCGNIVDGMGLGGIRRRLAEIGGETHISGDGGFTINMLIPIE